MGKITDFIKNNKDRDFTLNDVIVKKYEIWLAIPAFLFILTPFIKFLVFSYVVNIHPLANEVTYFAIVLFISVISVIPAVLGVTGWRLSKKKEYRV